MAYRQRVAIQAPTEVRTPTGGVSYTYDVVPGMDSLPANIFAVTSERRGEDFTVVEDRYDIHLGGHYPTITTDMVVLDGEAVYDILNAAPTWRHSVTEVKAQRVAI